jgi:hypothetical protein
VELMPGLGAQEMISRGYKVIAMSREASGVGGKKSMDDVKKDFEVCGCRPSPSPALNSSCAASSPQRLRTHEGAT